MPTDGQLAAHKRPKTIQVVTHISEPDQQYTLAFMWSNVDTVAHLWPLMDPLVHEWPKVGQTVTWAQ